MADREPPARRFEYQTDELAMTELDRRVLAVLPMNMERGQWPTLAEVSEQADLTEDATRICLLRLRERYLVEGEDNGGGFARTVRGERANELGVDRPSDYTRFGPTDEPGQLCFVCRLSRAPAPTPEPDGAAGQGWLHHEDEQGFAWLFLCPDCQTQENVARWQEAR